MDSITTLVIGKPDKILLAKPFISQPFIIPGMPHAPSGLARNTLLRTRTTRPWMAQDTPSAEPQSFESRLVRASSAEDSKLFSFLELLPKTWGHQNPNVHHHVLH